HRPRDRRAGCAWDSRFFPHTPGRRRHLLWGILAPDEYSCMGVAIQKQWLLSCAIENEFQPGILRGQENRHLTLGHHVAATNNLTTNRAFCSSRWQTSGTPDKAMPPPATTLHTQPTGYNRSLAEKGRVARPWKAAD